MNWSELSHLPKTIFCLILIYNGWRKEILVKLFVNWALTVCGGHKQHIFSCYILSLTIWIFLGSIFMDVAALLMSCPVPHITAFVLVTVYLPIPLLFYEYTSSENFHGSYRSVFRAIRQQNDSQQPTQKTLSHSLSHWLFLLS